MNANSHRDIIKKVRTLRKRARQLKDYFLDEKITYRFINNYDLDSETYSQLNKLYIFEAVTRTTSKIKISRPTSFEPPEISQPTPIEPVALSMHKNNPTFTMGYCQISDRT